MHQNVLLNLRLKTGQNELVPFELDEDGGVSALRGEVAKLGGVQPSDVLLVLCGSLLNDGDTTKSAGIVDGDCIHCLRAKPQVMDVEQRTLSTIEAHELHGDLNRTFRGRNKRSYVQHVCSLEFSRKALQRLPELRSDPDCLALVQDAVMLHNFCSDTPDALKESCNTRPALISLLQFLVSEYKEWTSSRPSASSPSASAPLVPNYSLDALYEPEDDLQDMPGSSIEEEVEAVGAAAAADRLPAPLPTITPAQLAAALANATGAGRPQPSSLQPPGRSGSAGGRPSSTATPWNTPHAANTPHTSNTPSSASTSSSHTPASLSASTPHGATSTDGQVVNITSEMLQNALQSVLSGAAAGSPGNPSAVAPPPTGSAIPNLEDSVRLMAEMGIPDEALSRQALIMTNGDVQSAVDIVFAQLNLFE